MQKTGILVLSRRLKKTVLAAVIMAALYTLTGFFIVPALLKSLLPQKLGDLTHRTVMLESAAFNPFALSVTLQKLVILEKDQSEFASVGRLYVNAQLLPLVIGKAVLKDLVIEQPSLSVRRDKKGGFNFDDLTTGTQEKSDSQNTETDGGMPSFLIKSISISAGQFEFADHSAGNGFKLTVAPFSVDINNLGSREETPASYRFKLATRSGAAISGSGTASLGDLISEGSFELKGLPITQFEPYYRQFIKAHIQSGRAGVKFSYRYPAGPTNPLPGLADGSVSLKDFAVTGPKGSARLVSISEFAMSGIQLDPEKQAVTAGRLLLADTDIQGDRSKDGGIYLVEAFLPVFDEPQQPSQPSEIQKETRPWTARLEQLDVQNLALAIKEYSAQTPSVYKLKKLTAQARGIEYDTSIMQGIPQVAEAGLTLNNFTITPVGNDKAIAAIPVIEIKGVHLDPLARLATVQTVNTSQGELSIHRTAAGQINLIKALPAIIAPVPDEAAPAAPDQTKQAPLVANIAAVVLEDYALTFRDEMLKTPALLYLDRISTRINNLSSAPKENEKAALAASLRWHKGGSLTTKGSLSLSPLSGEMIVSADQLDIAPIQPYLNEKVNLLITGGQFNTTGKATFQQDPELGFKAAFKGKSLLANFTSLDKHLGKDFLHWKTLDFSGIDVTVNPLAIKLDEIALADFYARATVNADGTINLRTVLASEAEPGGPVESDAIETTEPSAQTPPGTPDGDANPLPPIAIKAITLQGGTVSFADRLVTPHFETEMLELGGNISGLSSEELARADVFLAGRLENHSPLKITGKINPLSQDRFTDISIEFRDIDLSPFTPYTGKYLGYKLEKGKLTLVLNYKLSQNTLVAQNKIQFNRLTLGDKVDSPDAISLPVKLGLAILSDREGNVELDLPVSGSVDDPEFSLGSIIMKALVGLITKAISAPFAALGSAFGGGAELSYIDFTAGQANVGIKQVESLEVLANALYERPALSLEITGMAAPDSDAAQLRDVRYNDLLLAQQARELYKDGQAPAPQERPGLTPEQRDAYIAQAFSESELPKPKNPDGTLKELPVAEMEKLLYTAIIISSADLRQLAMERAETAKDTLLKDERLQPERLYITEPILAAPTDAAEPLKPRVRFAIQK